MAETYEIKRLQLGASVETIVRNADDNFVALFDTVDNLDETINGVLNASQAMVFKGTLGTGGTITQLPTTGYSSGDTYKVVTNGTYAGKHCEVGDIIICLYDYTDNSKPSNYDDHWTVVQANIDGAVTGPSSSEDNHVAVFSGKGGNIIKDSGFTIDQIGLVKDVQLNGESKLDKETGIANIVIKVEDLKSEYTEISADSLATKTVNNTRYYAIQVVDTNVPLEVYNSNGEQILTHTVHDDTNGYLYICVGTTAIDCLLRKVKGNSTGVSGGGSSSGSIFKLKSTQARPMVDGTAGTINVSSDKPAFCVVQTPDVKPSNLIRAAAITNNSGQAEISSNVFLTIGGVTVNSGLTYVWLSLSAREGTTAVENIQLWYISEDTVE